MQKKSYQCWNKEENYGANLQYFLVLCNIREYGQIVVTRDNFMIFDI